MINSHLQVSPQTTPRPTLELNEDCSVKQIAILPLAKIFIHKPSNEIAKMFGKTEKA